MDHHNRKDREYSDSDSSGKTAIFSGGEWIACKDIDFNAVLSFICLQLECIFRTMFAASFLFFRMFFFSFLSYIR